MGSRRLRPGRAKKRRSQSGPKRPAGKSCNSSMEGSPRELAAGASRQPFDREERVEAIMFLQGGRVQPLVPGAGDKQGDNMSQLCKSLADLHHLDAVGRIRRDLRRRNANYSHFSMRPFIVINPVEQTQAHGGQLFGNQANEEEQQAGHKGQHGTHANPAAAHQDRKRPTAR